MKALPGLIRRFFRGEEAATTFEYAVVIGVVIMAYFATASELGEANAKLWSHISKSVSDATSGEVKTD